MHDVGAALLIGQHGSARAVVHEDAFFLGRYLGHGQCRGAVGAAKDQADVLLVNPFTGLAGGNIGLVLVVGRQQLDGLAQYFAAKVINGHLYGRGTVPAFHVSVEAGHIGDKANLDDVWLLELGVGGTAQQTQCAEGE